MSLGENSANQLANYLRQASAAAIEKGVDHLMVTVPKPFALPLWEAAQIADRLDGTQLANAIARSERLRDALEKVIGEALRFAAPSGDLDALEMGIIALQHTAPDPSAVADSLRFVDAVRAARTALEEVA